MLSRLNFHARNAVLYGLSAFLPRALHFFLLPLYTAFLVPEDFGSWTLLNACLNALRVIMAMGFISAMIWSLNHRGSDPRITLSSAMIFLSATGALIGLVAIGIAPWFCPLVAGDSLPVGLFRLVALTATVEIIELCVSTFWRGRGNAGRFAWMAVMRFVIEGVLKIVFLTALDRGVAGMIESGLLTAVVTIVLALVMARGHFAAVFSWPVVRMMLGYGLPLVHVQLAFLVLDVADRYILNHFRGAHEVGIYSLGYNIGMAIQFICQTISLVWFPVMFRIAKRADASVLLGRLVTAYVILLASAGITLVAASGDLVRVMSTPDYAAAVSVVPCVVLAYSLQGLSQFINVGISTRGLTRISAVIAWCAASANILLNFLLIPRFGMYGAMWATLACSVFSFTAFAVVNHRLFPLRYEAWRILRVAALAGIVIAGIIVAEARLSGALSVFMKLLCTAAFLPLLLLTRCITFEELKNIRHHIAHRPAEPPVQ